MSKLGRDVADQLVDHADDIAAIAVIGKVLSNGPHDNTDSRMTMFSETHPIAAFSDSLFRCSVLGHSRPCKCVAAYRPAHLSQIRPFVGEAA
jgi:hypothetical protein